MNIHKGKPSKISEGNDFSNFIWYEGIIKIVIKYTLLSVTSVSQIRIE